VLSFLFAFACHGPLIYSPCESPSNCESPEGTTAECVDGDGGGFCTWACAADADCNPVRDEYRWDFVCAPFESSEGTHCFPACSGADDPNEGECPPDFSCRSTGGGTENEKVCYPT
jgi:hypothetical protein